MNGESCGACRFYKPYDGDGDGLCRRYPPTVQLVEYENPRKHYTESRNESVLPVVERTDWCGEFQRASVARWVGDCQYDPPDVPQGHCATCYGRNPVR